MSHRPFISIVDDDPSVRKALGRLLRTADMDVEVYASGEEFLGALSDRLPDCLVLDIRMRGMTGLDLRDRLASMGRRIPIVFITAHADGMAAEHDPTGAVADILGKPFDDAALLSAIARRVRHP